MKDYKKILEGVVNIVSTSENSDVVANICVYIDENCPELKESEDERIRKAILELVRQSSEVLDKQNQNNMIAWLEKQGEQKPCMIQWKGDNLKEVVGFTGKDKNFEKWFKSFEEYERYVLEHNNIFKLFNADGSHYEVPVGAWIVKTPDGYNVASKAIFRQKSVDTPKFKVGDKIRRKTPSSCDKDMQVARIEEDYYICNHIGKFSSEVVPFSKQSSYELIEQKPTWSAEDDRIYYNLLADIRIRQDGSTNALEAYCNEQIKWLKSIKERYTWKPSDEQMEVLLSEVTAWTKGCPKQIVLASLYNDLKKL